MAQFTDNAVKSFPSNTALEPHRLVLMNSSGNAAYTTAGSSYTGVTINRAVTAGDKVSVKLRGQGGTAIVCVDGAVTRGGLIYTAANGKASATVSGSAIGQALETATADGDEIEYLPF